MVKTGSMALFAQKRGGPCMRTTSTCRFSFLAMSLRLGKPLSLLVLLTLNLVQVKKDDSECVSASSDGSCIIWDLRTFKRRTSLFANTFFKSVIYHPDESQLVTTGTDRKVCGAFKIDFESGFK